MTGQVRTPGHIRMVLPGEWAHVPLADAETTRAFAQRLVKARVGRDDRLASVRRDAVTQLCETADKARASGSHTLAVALELVPGVPFAASMVGRDAKWPSDLDAGEPGSEEIEPAERLARDFPTAEVVELRSGPAARTVESGVLRGKEQEIASVSVAFRIPRPDSDDLLTLRFTGPDMGRPELIAKLFEAVADSVEFTRRRVLSGDRTE